MIGQRIRVAWFGGVLLSFIALPAMPQGNGSAAPQGSYLKTCSQIHFNGKVLMATCDNGRSRKLQSTINVTACDGDIWNNNGILTASPAVTRGEREQPFPAEATTTAALLRLFREPCCNHNAQTVTVNSRRLRCN
jgi:hypothetical protein